MEKPFLVNAKNAATKDISTILIVIFVSLAILTVKVA